MKGTRRIIIALTILLAVFLFGTEGFYLFEPTVDTYGEAMYFTLVTMTTVGYGDIVPTEPRSMFIASIVMIVGVGAMLSVLTAVFNAAITQSIREELGLPPKTIKIKDHFIICGFGNVGHQIAEQLKQKGEKYIIIEKDRSKVEQMVDHGIPVIEGHAEFEETLEKANIRDAKGMLTSLPEAMNVMVAITARMLNPDILIISEVEDYRNEIKLKKAGVDAVVHCHEMGARVMVNRARKAVIDIVNGQEVDARDTPYKTEYEGQTFYFVSAENLEVFKRSPEHFMEIRQALEHSCGSQGYYL